MSRQCKTCRFWDAHSIDMRLGSCRAPDNNRYWHAETNALPGGFVALFDSFGPEETKPNYSCHAWRAGEQDVTPAPDARGMP